MATDPSVVEMLLGALGLTPKPDDATALNAMKESFPTYRGPMADTLTPGGPIVESVVPSWKKLQRNALGQWIATQRAAAGTMPQELPEGFRKLLRRIQDRDVVYHSTTPKNMMGILADKEIRPAPAKYSGNPGVSVSRIPKGTDEAYEGSPITLAIDASKMPKNRPFVEKGWDKTLEGSPNPRFEFENRTSNAPIPASAIKEVLVDKAALHGPLPNYWNWNIKEGRMGPEDLLKFIKSVVEGQNIPVREFPNAARMRSTARVLP